MLLIYIQANLRIYSRLPYRFWTQAEDLHHRRPSHRPWLPSAGQVSGKEVCDRSTFEESRISRWVQVPSLIWLSAISQCARGQTTPLELRLERSAALVTTCALGCHSRHVIIFRAKTCRTGQPPSQWMRCRGWTAMQVNLCLEARETCSHGSLCLTKA